MCTENTEADLDRAGMPVARRSFTALAGAGALVAALPARAMAGKPVKGRDVASKTDDGICDAYFVAPAAGTHPAVLAWHDIRGPRPAFRPLADRPAGDVAAGLTGTLFSPSQNYPGCVVRNGW